MLETGSRGTIQPKVWEDFLSDITEQKRDGFTRLLTGVSTYLNKVGHHRNSKIKDNGNLPAVPIDLYKAELMISVSHLVVSYLERLSGGSYN
jgi:hypothetical protein